VRYYTWIRCEQARYAQHPVTRGSSKLLKSASAFLVSPLVLSVVLGLATVSGDRGEGQGNSEGVGTTHHICYLTPPAVLTAVRGPPPKDIQPATGGQSLKRTIFAQKRTRDGIPVILCPQVCPQVETRARNLSFPVQWGLEHLQADGGGKWYVPVVSRHSDEWPQNKSRERNGGGEAGGWWCLVFALPGRLGPPTC